MEYIIFDMILIFLNIWNVLKEDGSKLSKCFSLLAIILLTISITLRVLIESRIV